VYISRIGVHLGKFPMVRRTLFCRRFNFKRQVSAANSQAGQAWVITVLINALWRVSLILALKRCSSLYSLGTDSIENKIKSKSKTHCDWGSWPDNYYFLTVAVLFFWGTFSDERTGLSFVYTAGHRQRSLSRVASGLRLPFRRLIRLAGSRWRYSNPPPHGL
jgi:hypothetical protein